MQELQGSREAEREAASKQLDEAAAAHAVLQDRCLHTALIHKCS